MGELTEGTGLALRQENRVRGRAVGRQELSLMALVTMSLMVCLCLNTRGHTRPVPEKTGVMRAGTNHLAVSVSPVRAHSCNLPIP